MVWSKLQDHWGKLAVVLAALLILPSANSVIGGEDRLVVSTNAPQKGDAMTVALSKKGGLIERCGGDAEVEVLLDEIIVYSSVLGKVPMDGCSGSIDIPYDRFASRNGVYIVRAEYGDHTVETPVQVEKVVNWVLVRSFPQEEHERTRVDVALDAARGQPLTSGIFTSGTLELDIRFEECTETSPLGLLLESEACSASKRSVFYAEIPVEDRASTHVFIPWENLASDDDEDGQPPEGYYNVTATFHNDEAKGNANAPMDPTVYREDPPGNWFEVSYE